MLNLYEFEYSISFRKGIISFTVSHLDMVELPIFNILATSNYFNSISSLLYLNLATIIQSPNYYYYFGYL